MLRDRLLTAAIGIPLFIAGIALGGLPFAVMLALIATVMAVELAGVLAFRGIDVPGWAVGVSAALFCILPVLPSGLLAQLLPAFDHPTRVIVIGAAVALAAALAAALSYERPSLSQTGAEDEPGVSPLSEAEGDGQNGDGEARRDIGKSGVFAGVLFIGLYIGFLLSLLVTLRQTDGGMVFVLAVLLSVWANDSAAYFVGKRFGRTKLAPKVSPNKTIEGSVAGLAAGTLAAAVTIAVGLPDSSDVTRIIIFGLVISIAGQLGDLFESAIKRSAGVKDSGSILPGHGGLLDRFDSLLFAGAAGYYTSLIL